ncbi:hypothetical protein EB670_24360 (plasmid) [Escherichia coli]|uniref:hypothetical protein n=1 Tax=Escherichia coli TaxID=562 RepID=UPI000900581C|nr:hypothetical protein [Escherichia coli]AYQ14532.1 hypothetical protein EB670_24360 [Escherichia coli]MBN4710853.1 hypothetical protein [Escherichia coli]MBP4055009.1 hypothetical protein [Escherichia coli]MBW4281680.1 hypothetical protein [Escherichia coli]MDT9056545.1 hypothetical protein [Escherichia coli]
MKVLTFKNDTVSVGDIFVSSWGYEQTNVTFYQVLSVHGKKTVTVREIRANSEYGNDSNLLIVFYIQIMPDDFVMQLHRF